MRRLLALATALSTALIHVRAVAAEPDATAVLSPEEEQRRVLYQRGREAIKAKNWEEARKLLEDAWNVRPAHDVALMLGQAEFNLNQFSAAANHLAYYLQNFPANEKEDALFNGKSAFAEAKRRVGALRISVDRSAEIYVDGNKVGNAPPVVEFFVEPGPHRIEARLGADRAEQATIAEAGRENAIHLTLVRATSSVGSGLEPSNAPPPSSTIDATPRTTSASWVPVYIGTGLTAVGVGAGFVFHFLAQSNDEDSKRLENLGPSGCLGPSAPSSDCNSAREAAEAYDRNRTLSTTAFVISGAAALGTLTYFLVTRPDHAGIPISTATHIGVDVSESGHVGVSLSGSF